MLPARLVGVAEGQRGRQEVPVGADGGLEVVGGGGGGAASQLQSPQLVVADGQPLGLDRAVARARDHQQPLLDVHGLVPVAGLDGQVAQAAQRLGVLRPALQHVPVEGGRLVGPPLGGRLPRPSHALGGLRVVLAGGGAIAGDEEAPEEATEGEEVT